MSERNQPDRDLCNTVSQGENGLREPYVKDARAIRTKGALRDALLRLLERRSFDQTTVRDICAEAGIHYATFFRHYPGKEALLDHIAAEQIATSVALALPIKDSGDDQGSLEALCAYVDKNRRLWGTLFNGGASVTMRAEWLRQARIVSETREPVSTWLPKELGTICSISLIVETIVWWLAQPDQAHSVADVSLILSKLIGSSIFAGD